MNPADEIRIEIQKLKKIPTLSYTAQKIISLTAKETTHLDELVEIIERDPPIMSKVLGVANIVYIGSYKPITSVKDALLKIGFKSLKNIALSIAVFSIFKPMETREESYKRLFKHSIITGIVSQIISEKYLNLEVDENFTAGALHDLGLLGIHFSFYEYFKKIESYISDGLSVLEAEKKAINTTHSEVGKWIAEPWGLPEVLQDVIFLHHENPKKSKNNSSTVALVHLSDYLAHELNYYPFKIKAPYDFKQEEVYEILDLPPLEVIINDLTNLISTEDIESL
ncbi:MAG: HDOD domain-containing protein [Thermodesulfovibrionaceae bacterium]